MSAIVVEIDDVEVVVELVNCKVVVVDEDVDVKIVVDSVEGVSEVNKAVLRVTVGLLLVLGNGCTSSEIKEMKHGILKNFIKIMQKYR